MILQVKTIAAFVYSNQVTSHVAFLEELHFSSYAGDKKLGLDQILDASFLKMADEEDVIESHSH